MGTMPPRSAAHGHSRERLLESWAWVMLGLWLVSLAFLFVYGSWEAALLDLHALGMVFGPRLVAFTSKKHDALKRGLCATLFCYTLVIVSLLFLPKRLARSGLIEAGHTLWATLFIIDLSIVASLLVKMAESVMRRRMCEFGRAETVEVVWLIGSLILMGFLSVTVIPPYDTDLLLEVESSLIDASMNLFFLIVCNCKGLSTTNRQSKEESQPNQMEPYDQQQEQRQDQEGAASSARRRTWSRDSPHEETPFV